MVSLLTADGLTHRALVQPVVIGSTPGAVTTRQGRKSTPDKFKDEPTRTRDAAKDVKTADDKKVIRPRRRRTTAALIASRRRG